jgi:hypothetical protein
MRRAAHAFPIKTGGECQVASTSRGGWGVARAPRYWPACGGPDAQCNPAFPPESTSATFITTPRETVSTAIGGHRRASAYTWRHLDQSVRKRKLGEKRNFREMDRPSCAVSVTKLGHTKRAVSRSGPSPGACPGFRELGEPSPTERKAFAAPVLAPGLCAAAQY